MKKHFALSLALILCTGCTIPAGNFLANGYVSGVLSGGGGLSEVATAWGVQALAYLGIGILAAGLGT